MYCWSWLYWCGAHSLPLLGTLLRKLENGLRGISHLIVDEIHERDINVSNTGVVARNDFSLETN